jgi:Outer mitochondrial membrane transport complex protein/Glutathione S-transferase, C-terminal domain
MSTTNQVSIHQFREDYLLSTYCRVARIPYSVQNSQYITYASTNDLPQLQYQSTVINWRKGISFLKTLVNIDESLSVKDQDQNLMLVDLIQSRLHDVYLYYLYNNVWQYTNVTIHLNKLQSISPLKWILPSVVHKVYLNYLLGKSFSNNAFVEMQAIEAYKSIEHTLERSNGPFFFGKGIHSADIALYAHLKSIEFEHPASLIRSHAPRIIRFLKEFESELSNYPLSHLPCGGKSVFAVYREAARKETSRKIRGDKEIDQGKPVDLASIDLSEPLPDDETYGFTDDASKLRAISQVKYEHGTFLWDAAFSMTILGSLIWAVSS